MPESCEAGRTRSRSFVLPRVGSRSSIHEARFVKSDVENHSLARMSPSWTSTDIFVDDAATDERSPSSYLSGLPNQSICLRLTVPVHRQRSVVPYSEVMITVPSSVSATEGSRPLVIRRSLPQTMFVPTMCPTRYAIAVRLDSCTSTTTPALFMATPGETPRPIFVPPSHFTSFPCTPPSLYQRSS